MNGVTSCAFAGAQRACLAFGGRMALPLATRLLTSVTMALGIGVQRRFRLHFLGITGLACMLAATGRAQWTAQDIGSVAASGQSSNSSGAFSVAGSGADIWGPTDAFQFYSQPLAGDGTITARVTGMTDTNGWAKAGVMIRDTLAANAANVFLAATPEWHGITAQQRASAGADTTNVAGPAVNPSYWLRLIRSGSTITAATSPDGSNWTPLANFSPSLSSTAYVGLAVTSHNDGTLCSATFDNVAVVATGNPSGVPSAPANLTATAVSSSQISLSWTTTSTNQTSFSIERPINGSFTQVGTAIGSATSFTDSGLSPSLTYGYQVRAVNSSGYGPASNIASATTMAAPAGGTFQSADIGTSTAGQTSASGDTVTLTGSGRDIWNNADGFRYYYQSIGTGDMEMIVRVASLQDVNGWSKAGIMVRQSLDPGSPQAWVCVSAEHGTTFQWRDTANGASQSTSPTEDGSAPRWLKLVYKAVPPDAPIPPTITGYVSFDGMTWTAAGSFRLYSGNASWPYIGLAVTSHNDGTLCTAQFDNVRSITPPPEPGGFQVTHRGPNGEIDVAWTESATDVDRFEIKTNPQVTGNHDWTLAASASGAARQATVYIGLADGAQVEISGYRDFVRSPVSLIWAKPTITPSLALTGTTTSSVTLRITEQFGYGGGENGPWNLERSTDGVSFQVIASGLTPTGGTAYSDYTDYTDTGLPNGATRYYRARQLLTNGDSSAYSSVVSATTSSSTTGVPVAPSNLSATALSSTSVRLDWTDNSSDEQYFEIGRSTDNTTFYSRGTVSANTTTFTDTAASPGTLYYYRVLAYNYGGGAASNVASVTTPATSTGSTWLSQDIGSPAAHGSVSTSSTGDSVTVSGSGWDIWGGTDAFQFAYQALNGAGTLTARVASMTDTNGWAKAGLMIRSSLEPTAINVFLAATPEWNGIVGQHRDSAGADTVQVAGPATAPPCWLRITRASDGVHVFTSSNGTVWTEFASWPMSLMNSTAYIGFAVTSHHDGSLCTATFDHVSFTNSSSTGTSTTVTAPQVTSVSASGGAGTVSSDHLSATVTVTHPNDNPVFSGTATAGNNVYLFAADPATHPGWLPDGSGSVDTSGHWSASCVVSSGGAVPGQAYDLYYYASDGQHTSATQRITLVVNAPPGAPVVSAATVNGQVGAAITPVQVQATNSPTNFSAALSAYGLSISNTGVISGTPSTAANGVQVVVYATNSAGYGQNTVRLDITDTAPTDGSAVISSLNPGTNTSTTSATTPNSDFTVRGTANAGAQFSLWLVSSTDSRIAPHLIGNIAADSSGAWQAVIQQFMPGTYGFAVAAQGAAIPSSASFTVTIQSPTGTGTWDAYQINNSSLAYAAFDAYTVMLDNTGTDIGGTTDSFEFFAQPISGDVTLTAHITSLAAPSLAKAGVMIREASSPDARNVFAAVTPGSGVVAQARTDAGGPTASLAGPAVNGPGWVRLVRTGSTFTAWYSSNGDSWTQFATFNVAMSAAVYVGLAVTSHDTTQGADAHFDHLAVTLAPSSGGSGGSWTSQDVGAVGLAGSTNAAGSSITVNGAGADVWGTADGFRYVSQPWTGDGVVEARVSSIGNTNGWAKAGVMIRESADPGSRNVFVALTPTWHGIVAQARTNPGDVTTQAAGPTVNAPYWVRVARTGNTFTASTSTDGVTWTTFTTFNVAMSSTALFGFAVTSHDTGQLNQAVFDDPYVGSP